jgi:hypothetical protein
MIHIRRSRRDSDSQPHFGRIDEDLWKKTVRALLVARGGKHDDYLAAVRELTDGLDDVRLRLAGLYLVFMIRFWISSLLGHAPTDADIPELSNSVRASYHRLISSGVGLLDATVCTACDLATPDERVRGGLFQIRAIAILGLLLEDPVADLRVIKAHLRQYCETDEANLRRMCQPAGSA